MLYSVRQVIADTRIALDHNADERPLIQVDDPYTLTLDQLIAANIQPAAREVLAAADPQRLGAGIPVEASLVWPERTGWGRALLPLPDDFLRLLSVAVSDWRRPARIIADTHPDYRWQSSPFAGVRGNPDRPVAVVCQRPWGRVAELYSSCGGSGVTLLHAQYVAEPHITSGHIEWPEALHHDIITRIALFVVGTIGTSTLADDTTRYRRTNNI